MPMDKIARDRVRIRPETAKDYKEIIPLVLRSFSEGTDYSDGTDVMAFIEEIRQSRYYLPGLSFVAEMNGEIVGHFMFSLFPLSDTPEGDRDENKLQPVKKPPVVTSSIVETGFAGFDVAFCEGLP